MPPELEKRIAGESFAVTGVGMRNKKDHTKIMISSNKSLYMLSRVTFQFDLWESMTGHDWFVIVARLAQTDFNC